MPVHHTLRELSIGVGFRNTSSFRARAGKAGPVPGIPNAGASFAPCLDRLDWSMSRQLRDVGASSVVENDGKEEHGDWTERL